MSVDQAVELRPVNPQKVKMVEYVYMSEGGNFGDMRLLGRAIDCDESLEDLAREAEQSAIGLRTYDLYVAQMSVGDTTVELKSSKVKMSGIGYIDGKVVDCGSKEFFGHEKTILAVITRLGNIRDFGSRDFIISTAKEDLKD